MIVKPYHILVKITEESREKLFNNRLKIWDGRYISIYKDIKQEKGSDSSFLQDVNVAEVIEVGAGVEICRPGDSVIIDYLVDTTDDTLAWSEWSGKYCVLDMRTSFYKKDLIAPATSASKIDVFVYKKGEMEEFSQVIAVITKQNRVVPNYPYVFTEHKESTQDKVSNGVIFTDHEKYIIKRRVAFGYPGSELKPGQDVLLESDFIFFRKIGDIVFDICFESDVVGYVE